MKFLERNEETWKISYVAAQLHLDQTVKEEW